MKSTQHLVPAVLRKEGTIDYGTLMQTAIVVLKPGDIDERGSLHGGRDVATFVTRAEKFWPLNTRRLLPAQPVDAGCGLRVGH
jgi:hypothetical protein